MAVQTVQRSGRQKPIDHLPRSVFPPLTVRSPERSFVCLLGKPVFFVPEGLQSFSGPCSFGQNECPAWFALQMMSPARRANTRKPGITHFVVSDTTRPDLYCCVYDGDEEDFENRRDGRCQWQSTRRMLLWRSQRFEYIRFVAGKTGDTGFKVFPWSYYLLKISGSKAGFLQELKTNPDNPVSDPDPDVGKWGARGYEDGIVDYEARTGETASLKTQAAEVAYTFLADLFY